MLKMMAASDATQDQEMAAAIDWMNASNPGAVVSFCAKVNEADGPELRGLSDLELTIVRGLTMIALYEVAKAAQARGAA